MIAIIVAVLLTVISTFVIYFKWSLQYWNRKGLENVPGTIPFGSIKNPAKYHSGLEIKRIYHEMRVKGWRHGGLYVLSVPLYLVLDLDYVKNVLTKDFQYFTDRSFYYNEKDDPISAHLLAIGGTKWKNLRAKLTPTFTSSKMKIMFPTLVECLQPLAKSMEEYSSRSEAVNIKEVLGCFTMNIIGSCAFGLEFNTFQKQNSPFRVHGKRVLTQTRFKLLKVAFASNFRRLGNALKILMLERETSEFFFDVVRKTVEFREKNNFSRPDFMQLLIDMKNKNAEEYNHDGTTLTFEEIVAQAVIFFIAGFETSSATMTFALYEMAANQEVQEKVREEVNRVVAKHGGEITYEALHELKYMGQVIDETLRKYPPAPYVTRECVKDYKVPDVDLVIEKGTRVGIPVMGIHYDSEYYPDPEKFDPERFSEENRQNRNQYAHIPFGGGPRFCIGRRFGIMQTKVGLAALLRSYNFTVNKRTKEPIQFDLKSLVLAARCTVWLNVQKI